ncbi:hypothetical protein P12x_001669 [Tundrisphaera lichenicola]|uniref:hypothetical protein n=1 Tax=Tundrisphaera lichenicola TaxID=2029860 RepID=UPI003EBB1328
MAAEDLLRLAWEADHDGRQSLRDALLTLAIAESGPDDDWAERCRNRLVSERPGHYLGVYPTVAQALIDPRVIKARDRLRCKYPAERVEWLLLRARAARGTYTGRGESIEAMIEDLTGPRAEAENFRLDAPAPIRGPRSRIGAMQPVLTSLLYPPMARRSDWLKSEPGGPSEKDETQNELDPKARRYHYYSTLFALAMVLAALPEGDSSGS